MNHESLIGKRCWQSQAFKIFLIGTIEEVKSEKGWTIALVKWDRSKTKTWEKIMNLGFCLPEEALSLIQS